MQNTLQHFKKILPKNFCGGKEFFPLLAGNFHSVANQGQALSVKGEILFRAHSGKVIFTDTGLAEAHLP